nr:MAG TPA: hypothetical protein [Caudoviricetes sp.]
MRSWCWALLWELCIAGLDCKCSFEIRAKRSAFT